MAYNSEFLEQQIRAVEESLAKDEVSDAVLRRLRLKRSVIEAWSSLMTGDASHHHDGNNHHDHTQAMLGAESRVINPAALGKSKQQA